MITLKNIGMTFAQGTPDENCALKNINLDIQQGDFITVIGSNGAGKSTLYNVIAGTLTPTTGNIYLDVPNSTPQEITKDKEYKRARYIGRIFQNPLLGTAGKMTLEDNMMICHKKGYKGLKISLNKSMRDYFRSQLELLEMGLEDRLNDNVEQFSGGQRQALTLLMTVMSKPNLLLLDEHTAALDPGNAELVMKLTRKFAKNYNLTVMMITHNMQQALDYGNRLIMMDSGDIILDINAQEKAKLTLNELITRFRALKQKDLNSDAMLLQ
ncbi:MAG: ABC transporter ATP-binding protein [Treponema sp. CETP13]|nr:MAG: ABC transporter ATP-binding protein [Treponema sp. CETP13]